MRLSLIVALAATRVIGVDTQLPWHLPADLKRFKQITMGKPIVMGRKTFESIGRPLPGREMVVVTRNHDFHPPDCSIFHSLEEALDANRQQAEVIGIGGTSLYQQLLPIADRLYLTLLHTNFDGDTFFPDFDQSQWYETAREDYPASGNRTFEYSFLLLERRQPNRNSTVPI